MLRTELATLSVAELEKTADDLYGEIEGNEEEVRMMRDDLFKIEAEIKRRKAQ